MQIALDDTLNLAQRLESARPFAADSHFGVREFAWMSVRPAVAQEVDAALSLLQPWVAESDANLRRFASELTRPRGVWCVHLEILKSNPERGIALLTPLMADASRYVQDSVANWLNDAAKSCPDWTRKTCKDWLANNAGKATQRICQRGQRSLKPA
jgi:3-methyladenine DNA glycosylase AlkC